MIAMTIFFINDLQHEKILSKTTFLIYVPDGKDKTLLDHYILLKLNYVL